MVPARPFVLKGAKRWSIVVKKILFATAASAAFSPPPRLSPRKPVPLRSARGSRRWSAMTGSRRSARMTAACCSASARATTSRSATAFRSAPTSKRPDSTQKEGDADVAEVKAGRDLYAGGRVSFAVSPTANLYVKGGYTNARFKATDGVDSFSENFDGFRLGAGGQIAVSGKAYVGGEYRYSNYEARPVAPPGRADPRHPLLRRCRQERGRPGNRAPLFAFSTLAIRC